MQPIRCASSLMLTKLLVFRNPVPRELDFGQEDYYILFPKIKNVITTQICLFLLATTSTIETLAYVSLTFLSLVLYPITDKPFLLFKKLLESSSFTIIWSLADAVIYNLFFQSVITDESFARYWANQFNFTPIILFRDEDFFYFTEINRPYLVAQHNLRHDPSLDPSPLEQEIINKGANFIKDKVLAGATAETIESFKDMDPVMFLFIATKAAYIYGFGELKNEEIPPFFKKDTKENILKLRKKSLNAKQAEELARLIKNPTSFDSKLQVPSTLSIFNLLRAAGSTEVVDPLIFTTKCYQKAISLFNPKASTVQE